MAYVVLTGVTGLLGRYLVKDLLLANTPTAVLVRPNRRQSGRQRVEGLMQSWEERLGRLLPRPIVLEGDISEPDLGLDSQSIRWLSENCDTMLHNAASLEFQATSPESEPYRSNVRGTQNVLDVCQQAGIRKFHHVSTAYVCGLRNGVIREDELDVGQTLSNDYESSKVAAEKLVRSCTWLESLTVHRPAIIIGDSTNGYTSTYFGFYAPLQLLWTIKQQFQPTATGHTTGESRFPMLNGSDTKNLVPVDWVSAVMSHVVNHPEHHGKTYHLTPRHPITVRLMADVLEQSNHYYGVSFREDCLNKDTSTLTEYERLFYDMVKVYQSYWRNDPTFDSSNTVAAAPHLPCPLVNRKLLMKMAEYAIGVQFGTPRERPVEPAINPTFVLGPFLDLAEETLQRLDRKNSVALSVDGPGGGQWSLFLKGRDVVAAEPGVNGLALGRIQTDSPTLAALAQRTITLDQAITSGNLHVTSGGLAADDTLKLFSHILQQAARRELVTKD